MIRSLLWLHYHGHDSTSNSIRYHCLLISFSLMIRTVILYINDHSSRTSTKTFLLGPIGTSCFPLSLAIIFKEVVDEICTSVN